MKTLILLISLTLISHTAQARLVQILHTNDLHSFFEGTRSGPGGYAKIKTVIDELKLKAAQDKIPTLILDGGDFGEGSSFFLSNGGVDSIKALDLLGIDVSVIGNHDYLLGGPELSRQLTAANPKVTILSANLENKKDIGLQNLVPGYKDINLDGLRLRIIGLSTSAIHFQYPLNPLAKIRSAITVGLEEEKKAAAEGLDFVVALTHLGHQTDKQLAKKSTNIHLIVGGHSHARFDEVQYLKNKNNKNVPMIQAGAQGLAVGSLLIDIAPEGQSKIISYKLHDITPSIESNPQVEAFVANAYKSREAYFGRQWNEVIGSADFPLSGYVGGHIHNTKTCWSKHMAELTRLAAESDYGIQIDNFNGEQIPAGNITFGDIIDNFPHFNKYGDNGWKISKSRVNGKIAKEVMKIVSRVNVPATISGPTQRLIDSATYTISFPSEIALAAGSISTRLKNILMPGLIETNVSYWTSIEEYIRANSPLTCGDDR